MKTGWANNIPSQQLGLADTRTPEQRQYARTAYVLWLSDLENIRREAAFKNDEEVEVLTITRHISMIPKSDKGKVDNTKKGPSEKPVTITVEDLTSPSPKPPPKTLQNRSREPDPWEFYFKTKMVRGGNERLLHYQIRDENVGNMPGPGWPRFKMEELRRNLKLDNVKNGSEIADITRTQLNAMPLPFETSVETNWVPDARGKGSLLRGFPMMEDVVFMSPRNFRGIESNCLWKAIAYQVYGNYIYDIRVKAEHLAYFSEVLCSPEHPKRRSLWFCGSCPYFSRPGC